MYFQSANTRTSISLSPAQQAAVSRNGSLGVIAGPGAGKTTVLTRAVAHSIASGWAEPEQHVLLGFTNRAAMDLRARLDLVGVPGACVSTLHSFCLQHVLRPFCGVIGYERRDRLNAFDPEHKPPALGVVFGERKRALIAAAHDEAITHASIPAAVAGIDMDVLARAIASFKIDGVTPDQALARAADPTRAFAAAAYAAYQRALIRAHAEDADGLIFGALRVLERSEEARAFIRAQFRRVYIDEVQDLSQLQWRLILTMLGLTASDGERAGNLCIVGDHLQSIYAFRHAIGADIFNVFLRDVPDATLIALDDNQRSRGPIVTVANALFAREARVQQAARADGPPVFLLRTASEHEQARVLTRQIEGALASGIDSREIAVLARTRRQIDQIEERLINAGVPYRIPERDGFWGERPILDVRALLELTQPGIEGDCDNLALRSALAIPGIGLDAGARQALRGCDDELVSDHLFDDARLARLTDDAHERVGRWVTWLLTLRKHASAAPDTVIAWILDLEDGMGYASVLARYGARGRQLVERLHRYAARFSDTRALLDAIALSSGDDLPGDGIGRVTLATLHAAKGLEFDVVFLAGVNDGVIPHHNALNSRAALAEELRLLYVGMTRPRALLCMTYARAWERTPGVVVPLARSRFLTGLTGPIETRCAPDWIALDVSRKPA